MHDVTVNWGGIERGAFVTTKGMLNYVASLDML
jgi:hypothetical protein